MKDRKSAETDAPKACKQGISEDSAAHDTVRSVEEADSEEAKDSEDSEDSDDGHHIPFGPAIALAAWLVLLWGQPLVDWYQSLLGF
ncbi:MAG: prepilin peptidase [Parasporobacterium sp.]|nr:prepilin peptidase [Parasporobacterium sp.]